MERKTMQVILNWIFNYVFADIETMSQGINYNALANLQYTARQNSTRM